MNLWEINSVKHYNILKVTDNETKWVINAIDSFPDYRLIESKDIFKLEKIKFEYYIFCCPKNPDLFPLGELVHSRLETVG